MGSGKIYPKLTVCVTLLLFAIGCHNHDPSPIVCRPHTLQLETDSVVYIYDNNNRITIAFYYSAGRQNKRDDYAYSSNRLTSVAKSSLRFDNTWATSANHSITYGSDGLPLSLVTDSDNGHLTTTFTHDNNKRLTEAETTSGFNKLFVGTTRYEYDADGNIPKVYYTINLNQQIQEVLARENLSFDTKDKFYIGVPELKIVNEYVYGFLPNKNNCLESTVYYYNYAQRFVEPQAITLTSAYDEQGLITSLKSATSGQFYSGEVLFNNVLYNCN